VRSFGGVFYCLFPQLMRWASFRKDQIKLAC
jgi:hypothetical protein